MEKVNIIYYAHNSNNNNNNNNHNNHNNDDRIQINIKPIMPCNHHHNDYNTPHNTIIIKKLEIVLTTIGIPTKKRESNRD